MDNMKLGQDVLVSNQVSSLLQSILQLYKLNLPADFVSVFSWQPELMFQSQIFQIVYFQVL